jgi:hypothetical protein
MDSALTLTESSAIVEYIIYKHSDGTSCPSPGPPRLCRLPLLVSLLECRDSGDNWTEYDDRAAQLPIDHPVGKYGCEIQKCAEAARFAAGTGNVVRWR